MKVCILAAGKGTRVSAFGGQLHKALLPVGSIAVISRIIGQFPPETHFVIAVGYLADQLRDYLAIAHPGLACDLVTVDRFEGPGAGPGYSLWCCRHHLGEPFILTSCDTLLPAPPPAPARNWLAVHSVENPALWCTVATAGAAVTGLHYKSAEGTGLAFIGVAGVHDAAVFWAALETAWRAEGEFQVNPGLEALIARGLGTVEMPWLDTGTDETYAETVTHYDKNLTFAGKTTDVTYRLGGLILKFFPDPADAERRFRRGDANRAVFAPVVGRRGHFYSYRYVEGELLSGRMDGPVTARVLAWLEQQLWRPMAVDTADFQARCRRFYRDKTLQRLDAFLKAFQPEDEPASLRLNGVACRTARAAIEAIPDGFWTGGLASSFHGDLHDGNIIATPDGFTLIDWRQDFDGLTEAGDRYYDLAKFFHTLDLSIGAMDRGDYAVEPADAGWRLGHGEEPGLDAARDAFWEFIAAHGYDPVRVQVLNALIFLNMAPLYARPMAVYLYHLGRLRLEHALTAAATAPAVTLKPWGKEILVTCNEAYALKDIHIVKGTRSSLQSHVRKLETILILSGRVRLERQEPGRDAVVEIHGPGSAYTLRPGTRHRVTALEDARLIEASTPELDDVVRHADDYQRT